MSGSAEQLVEEARRWIGVRFRHQGRDRNGVDCLGLLVCVAQECMLMRGQIAVSAYDQTDYGHIPDAKRLYAGLCTVMNRIDTGQRSEGDVALMRLDDNAQHLALLGDYYAQELSLIHAYAPARKVVEHRMDALWTSRIVAIFRFGD